MDRPRRHHYIPQFLLSGFASRETKKDIYTWMFRRGIDPKETNIKNVAQERDFHGDPQTSKLEYLVRDYETDFAQMVTRLRENSIQEHDITLIRAFVAHLLIRTKNVRASFAEGAITLFAKVQEAIPRSNRRKWKHELHKAARKEFRESGVRDRINSLPLAQRRLAKQMVQKKLREIDLRKDMGEMLYQFRQNVDIQAVVANAHVKVLTENIVPKPRVESIAHLQWQVMKNDCEPFILGDVGVIGQLEGEDGAELQSLLSVTSPIKMVVLPISRNVCLVGKSELDTRLPSIEKINLATAELSREFFIADQVTEREKIFHKQLGTRSEIIGDDEISKIVDDLM